MTDREREALKIKCPYCMVPRGKWCVVTSDIADWRKPIPHAENLHMKRIRATIPQPKALTRLPKSKAQRITRRKEDV